MNDFVKKKYCDISIHIHCIQVLGLITVVIKFINYSLYSDGTSINNTIIIYYLYLFCSLEADR